MKYKYYKKERHSELFNTVVINIYRTLNGKAWICVNGTWYTCYTFNDMKEKSVEEYIKNNVHYKEITEQEAFIELL